MLRFLQPVIMVVSSIVEDNDIVLVPEVTPELDPIVRDDFDSYIVQGFNQ